MNRLLNIIFLIFISIIAVPLIFITAILVRVKLGANIFFTQERPGYKGKPFMMYKFRTMNEKRDSQGNLLPDAQRLTRFGKLLRSTSLDELPALWNVLKGDMNLVGPRPLLMDYLKKYTKEQHRRHDVLPGITGWAQVNGRNSISWHEKFALDLWYVDNRSFWLDMKILLLTIKKVIIRDGINASNDVTMEKFTG